MGLARGKPLGLLSRLRRGNAVALTYWKEAAMPRVVLIGTLATVALPLLAGRASADIIQYESLDLAVASADLVIRGDVVAIDTRKGDNGVVWNRLTVKVAETIKGEELKEVSFLVREDPFAAGGTGWRNLRDEMFFCLDALKVPQGPFRVDYSLRGGWLFWALPLTGAPGTRLPIYSIDFKALTSAKEILAAARAAAEAPAGKAKSRLEWIVDRSDVLMPHAVLYPDSERVREAARKHKVELVTLPVAAASAGGKELSARAQPQIDVVGAGETAMELAGTTKDPDARWMAIRILGSLRYERAIPLLLRSLSDPHHYVRSNAARALGDMKITAAAKPLTELLQNEKNGGVIQQTSLALANLGCADALPALKGAAKHEDVQTRMWVLQAIGRLGNKRDVLFLAGHLDDPSQSVQAVAAQAIEQITGADFGFPRRSGPSSPDEGLRRARAWWAEHKGEYGGR
jgi:hypothetical protein